MERTSLNTTLPLSDRPYLRTRQDGSVVTLTLSQGESYNPLSLKMIAALQNAVDTIATSHTVRAVILAGEGKGFSAGHDLKELRAHSTDEPWQRRLFAESNRLMLTLTRMPQPVIARVHGIASAAGCQLVSMCDLAVAADSAVFALPGVNVGIFCSTPAVGVSRTISRKRTMEMLLTGRTIDARTALEWGLVNLVVPAKELDNAIAEFTDIIVSRSAATIAIGKRAFYEQLDRPLDGALDVAGSAMTRTVLLADAAEGIDAFFEKRPARWQGA